MRRVVVLYDERTDLPGLADVDAGLKHALEADQSISVEIYREMMDLSRLDRDGYTEELRNHLAAKYRDKQMDVAVGVMGAALEFLLQHGSVVFPDARIVFAGIDSRELEGRTLPPNVSGVMLERKFAPTLQLAMSLHPGTTTVVVVSGTSRFDTVIREHVRAELQELVTAADVQYWSGASMEELSTRLSQLPPQSLVLYSTMFRDGAGKSFTPRDAVRRISEASSAPVYGFLDRYVGQGIVGGDVYSLRAHGEQVGRVVLQVLGGNLQSRSAMLVQPRKIMFDARQLQRWGIGEDKLPDDALVLFEPRSLWDEHRVLVLAAGSIIAMQLALIVGLALQRLRRHRAELRLRESESRFRSIANSAPVSIWLLDAAGRDEFFNDEWLRLVGCTTQEDACKSGWMGRVHPDHADAVIERFTTAFKAEVRFETELRLRCAGDVYRWMFCSGVPRYDAAGGFVGYVCSATDIEDRKQVEGAKVDLTHAARLVAIGELTATMAHELKQPISAILANVETAALLMRDGSARDEINAILQDIRDDDLRAAAAIARIGALVRKQEMQFEPLELRHSIVEVLRFIASECNAHGVQVRTELHGDLPAVFADRIHVQQVFLNLIMNAIDAMKASPVTKRRLTITTRIADASHAEIALADTGSGIDPAHLPHIFDSFFTTKRDGMGLGLRVVRSIVESHQGRIWAHNNAEAGATFHFTLPFATSTGDEAPWHRERADTPRDRRSAPAHHS